MKKKSIIHAVCWLLPIVFICIYPQIAKAAVKVPSLFSNHMILQADAEILFWGWADPGEEVTVTFKGKKTSVVTPAGGKWILKAGPFTTDVSPAILEIKGSNTIRIEDVLVGEVWLCGGQSNMQWEVKSSGDAEKEIAAADFPLIRYFRIPSTVAQTPAETIPDISWKICTPQNAGDFSGVAYYFGRSLFRQLNGPIGLINVSVGGTPVESWMNAEVLKNPAFAPVHERWELLMKTYPARRAKYEKDLAEWEQARAGNDSFTRKKPAAPIGPGNKSAPAVLYNGMIAPILSLKFRGVIWYQGEANASRWETYDTLFRTFIRQWREDFKAPDIPFYFVQLANFNAPLPEKKNYAWIREAQASALALPNTGMATAVDVGERDNIHPKNKQAVGQRLALLALNKVYNRQDEYSGPVLENSRVEANTMVLRFSHARGLKIKEPAGGTAFELAGKDRVFYPARATINERGELVVSAPQIKKPVSVRYAWDNVPDIILYNDSDLPAPPFRTDKWMDQGNGNR